jgi:hypothetical protein
MDLSINEGTLVVTGGPGDSLQSAIVIKKTPKGLSAAGAELMLLTQRYGVRNKDWTLKQQDLVRVDSKVYDTYRVVLTDGSERSVYFDITEILVRAAEASSRSRAGGQ